MALPPAEFQKKHDASLADIRQHWRAEKGELVNDGQGLYLTTDKFYGDFELRVTTRRCRWPTAAFTCAAARRCRSGTTPRGKIQARRGQGLGRVVEQRPGAPGKDPLVLADKPFGAMEPLPRHHGGREDLGLAQRQASRGRRARWRTITTTQAAGAAQRAPIQLQTHGGEIRWRNLFIREIGTDEANRILRRHGDQRVSSPFSTARTSPAGTARLNDYEV